MEAQFVDRILTCSDCHGEFIFTAGEQLFFHDKQFKNDPKRCKPCKSRRSGLSAAANGAGPAAAGLSRTETRTECSDCGVQTTVPFKPTQGRPVLCRQCFQTKTKAAAALAAAQAAAATATPPPVDMVAMQAQIAAGTTNAQTVSALTEAVSEPNGMTLSPDAAVLAAASMASASPQSSVASAADLASILASDPAPATAPQIPPELLAASVADSPRAELAAPSPDAVNPTP
jgi:CxxC-x17-CxxC domain-containing protein